MGLQDSEGPGDYWITKGKEIIVTLMDNTQNSVHDGLTCNCQHRQSELYDDMSLIYTFGAS